MNFIKQLLLEAAKEWIRAFISGLAVITGYLAMHIDLQKAVVTVSWQFVLVLLGIDALGAVVKAVDKLIFLYKQQMDPNATWKGLFPN